jgi:hypothetical protein
MKKFLAIAAVLILLLTLSVPAFAAPSPEYNDEQETVAEDGTDVLVKEGTAPEGVDGETLQDAMRLDGRLENAEVSGYDFFEMVALDENGNPVDRDYPIAFSFYYAKAAQVIAAYVQNGDRSWSWIDFRNLGNGMLWLSPLHLTPVTLVLGTATEEPAPADTTPAQGGVTPGGTTPGGYVPSPQTGYSIALWAILAVAMVACAGYCFVSARKKTAE